MFTIRQNDERVNEINIPASFMFMDVEVAKVNICIYRYGWLEITTKSVQAQNLLPYAISQKDGAPLYTWLIKRGMLRKSHRNIYFAELVLADPDRSEQAPFILSLLVNSVSLIDKFWLNPVETTSFEFNGARISFERKNWEEVDPFKNLYHPGEIDKYGLCEIFCFAKQEPIDARSLIWSTQGWTNKRWAIEDGYYVLEKQLRKRSLDNEITTFEFFSSHVVLVPKYSLLFEEYDDEKHGRCYDFTIKDEGINIIRKQCLTDANSQLERLYEYIEDGDSIESATRRMCEIYNVSSEETEKFVQAIKQYQEKYNVSDLELDNRNLGLLVSDDGAKPVVWGRLKMRWDSFFRVLVDV